MFAISENTIMSTTLIVIEPINSAGCDNYAKMFPFRLRE